MEKVAIISSHNDEIKLVLLESVCEHKPAYSSGFDLLDSMVLT